MGRENWNLPALLSDVISESLWKVGGKSSLVRGGGRGGGYRGKRVPMRVRVVRGATQSKGLSLFVFVVVNINWRAGDGGNTTYVNVCFFLQASFKPWLFRLKFSSKTIWLVPSTLLSWFPHLNCSCIVQDRQYRHLLMECMHHGLYGLYGNVIDWWTAQSVLWTVWKNVIVFCMEYSTKQKKDSALFRF